MDLTHWHKIADEPSNLLPMPRCCAQAAGQVMEADAKGALRAKADAVHAERRRVVLEAVAGIEAYWRAAASVLPPRDPGTELAAAVVKQCLNTVRQVGCICPMVDVSTLSEARCGVHGTNSLGRSSGSDGQDSP